MLPLRSLATAAVLGALAFAGSTIAEVTFTGRDPATFAAVVAAVTGEGSGSGSKAPETPAPQTFAPEPATQTPVATKAATSTPSAAPKPSAPSGPWRMRTVTSIQARVQADEPFWDDEHGVYVSKFGTTFDEKHRGALDTVNTASVEGALMYVQAEGINVNEQSVKCERKNKMEYVVFYEFQIAQTVNSIAAYQNSARTLEYCPFVPMDGARCTPTDGEKLPKECYEFNGLEGEANLGPCVGGESKDSDFRAPYPNTYWFSFPNSCPGTARASKTDECRTEQPGGLCPFGKSPDGLACTFAYKVLGYLKIDDLVGITNITRKATGKKYANLKEFCTDGGVEFDATQDTQSLKVKRSLPFWKDPTNPKVNTARFQKMVNLYNKMVAASSGKMTPLPSVTQLQATNPACYENNSQCAAASNGCKRVHYYQACEVCKSSDAACVKAPGGFAFPQLAVNPNFKLDPTGSGGDDAFLNITASSSSGFGFDEVEVLMTDGSDLTFEDAPDATDAPSPTTAKPPQSGVPSLRVVAGSLSMAVAVAAAAVF